MAQPIPDLPRIPENFNMSAEAWRQLMPHVRTRTCRRDETLVRHGDHAQHLWLVYNGWVKLTRQTPDGKETAIGLCTAGEMFGEAALFDGGVYPYHAEALSDGAELGIIPARAVQDIMHHDTAFSAAVMTMLNERITQAELRLEHTSTMSAAQRFGCFLLRLAKGGGAKNAVEIPIEKHVLASYLGIKPETLSRSQQQLKALGVDISGPRVTLDHPARLREFVCSSCSKPPGNCNQVD